MTEPCKANKLIYNVLDRTAKKIATLVKIANLKFEIQQNHDQSAGLPHVLHTPSGELHKEYEIIFYVISQARQLSVNPPHPDRWAQEASPSEAPQGEGEPTSEVEVKPEVVINLQGNDPFITAKMYEKLYELRAVLFPLLHQFYKYMTGNEKTKKSKYDSLMNKIKKELGVLDADINEHPEIYHSQFNFLNIIIACEISMACKFVFEEKFRKSKYSLFNKYEKISHRHEFMEIHGKSELCQKEYIPSEFEEDVGEAQVKEAVIPLEIVKISNNILGAQTDSNRNQLLYNYFKAVLTQNESKKQYFPYFWLMFDELNCSIVEIVQNVVETEQENGSGKLKLLHKRLTNELKPEIDYGMLGLYRSEKEKSSVIRGLVCLGSKPWEELDGSLNKEEGEIKLHKVETNSEKERREVENIWEMESKTMDNEIKIMMTMQI